MPPDFLTSEEDRLDRILVSREIALVYCLDLDCGFSQQRCVFAYWPVRVVPLWELNFGDHTEYDNLGVSKTLLQAERSVLGCTGAQSSQLGCTLVTHCTFHMTDFLDSNIFPVHPPDREKGRLLSFSYLLSVAQLNRDIGAGSSSEHWRCLQDLINSNYCRALRNRNLFGHGGCVELLYRAYEGECRLPTKVVYLGTRGHFALLTTLLRYCNKCRGMGLAASVPSLVVPCPKTRK